MAQVSRNQPCPCGSGKKYKRCHLPSDNLPILDKQKFIEAFDKGSRIRECLHPQADRATCAGGIVDAHTVQRSSLKRLARGGHVYRTRGHRFSSREGPILIGLRDASTFSGFCESHDDQLFAPLEKEPWQATPLQVGLLGYRAVCHELLAKRSVIRGFEAQDRFVTTRYPHLTSILEEMRLVRMGARKAVEELELSKDEYHRVVFGSDLGRLSSYVVELANTPEVMCSATAQTTHDFRGHRIASFDDWDRPMNWTTFSLVATNQGGVAVFSWLGDSDALNERMIRTLDQMPEVQLPHAIIRYVFEFFENTFFAPEWWDDLAPPIRKALWARSMHGLPPEWEHSDACLSDDGIQAVDWTIGSRKLVFGSDPRAFELSA